MQRKELRFLAGSSQDRQIFQRGYFILVVSTMLFKNRESQA